MRKLTVFVLALCLPISILNAGSAENVKTFGMYDRLVTGSTSSANAVFSRPIDGQSDLWMVNLASGEEKRLTETNIIESNPVFCGNKIICNVQLDTHSQTDLAVFDLDGNSKMLSNMPGDESRFWVCGDLIVWVVEKSNSYAIWSSKVDDAKPTMVRGLSGEKPTHVLSNGKKVFWTQQDDSYDLDIWSYDLETKETMEICHEPGDQYCIGIEGNWVIIIGRYNFRPDRDLFAYSISSQVEIPIDTSRNDITSAAISNSHVAYLSQPIDRTTDCQLMSARLGDSEMTAKPVERVWLTEKERIHFSWPLAIWEDKRDFYDKGIDIWCYDFNIDRSFPVSLDPGNQHINEIKGSILTWITTRDNKYSISFKTISY